ncbi:MAG: POTRA domain-containing protein [Kofleriaceae bacterium]
MSTFVAVVSIAGAAHGQPELPEPVSDPPAEQLVPETFDPSSCSNSPAPVSPDDKVPVTWRDFEIKGELLDPPTVVHSLLAPTMNRYRALTADARNDVRRVSAAFGYHLVGLGTRATSSGTMAVVHLARLPIVREVDVQLDSHDDQLEDEVRRRLRVRPGSYLPWATNERKCELYSDKERTEEFLRDEGYFDNKVSIDTKAEGSQLRVIVKVRLGSEYLRGTINVSPPNPVGIPDREIQNVFRHRKTCYLLKTLCFGTQRFRREQHQKDLQAVVELFRQRGFPSVRVQTNDPATALDRRTKLVNFTVTIDPRRQLDVVFEGHNANAITYQQLRRQLTFDEAASSDDVEAHESAKAITKYLQSRGYFDARVTWSRERFERFDRLVFRIEEGKVRRLRSVDFIGNRGLPDAKLDAALGSRAARVARSVLTVSTAATSEQLDVDVALLLDVYRREGYRDTKIRATAATEVAALGDAAMTAAMIGAKRGDGLYIRYEIDEGAQTLISRISIELGADGDALKTPEHRAVCAAVLRELADAYGDPRLAKLAATDRCVTGAPHLAFREDAVAGSRDRIKDRLFTDGRPRAQVTFEPVVTGPHEVELRYQVKDFQALTIGTVVIRGNFRTRGWVIREELRFKRGAPLTKDTLAEAKRRLRTTGLFDSVNISMPDLENASAGSVNAVIEVTERYDYTAHADLEAGYSSYFGAFLRLAPSFQNLFGTGVSLDLAGAIGVEPDTIFDGPELRQLSFEGVLRFPKWISKQFLPGEPGTELSAFHRRQDTPQFGELKTNGASLAIAWSAQRARTNTKAARLQTFGLHYDFRIRERLVNVLRPIGADFDQTRVPISSRSGSVGASFEWEQRVNQNGELSLLDPQAGFRFEAQTSIASRYLGGQDTFLKVSAAGSKYQSIGRLVLRADLRYDQGFPLGGDSALLPELERFFAGGDSTVRGYDDERLATEIIEVAVPPLDNVTQIRVLPAGGNIRVLGSLDAQLKIWNLYGPAFAATGAFVDAGLITNQWSTVDVHSIRPSAGVAVLRVVTPFGTLAVERAVPLRPQFGDDPRGRWHVSFAARAQF